MKATFKTKFPYEGSFRFLYVVTGTEAELESYKEAQGGYYKEDKESGKALFYTSTYVGEEDSLYVNSRNIVVSRKVDELAGLNSLCETFPAMAGTYAPQMLKVVGMTYDQLEVDDEPEIEIESQPAQEPAQEPAGEL